VVFPIPAFPKIVAITGLSSGLDIVLKTLIEQLLFLSTLDKWIVLA